VSAWPRGVWVRVSALGLLVAMYANTTLSRISEWSDDELLLNSTQRTCEHSSTVRA
jgi:hypothetical protein